MARNELLQVERDALILKLLQERRAISVNELSTTLDVSPVTIRRDLQRLELRQLLQRTHGGAVILDGTVQDPVLAKTSPRLGTTTNLLDRIDVLITTYARIGRSRLLFEQAQHQGMPIIAESEMLEGARYVGIDNYADCFAFGEWAAEYAASHLSKTVHLLDITYHFPGSRLRSRGFIDGLTKSLPSAKVVLNVDGRSLQDEVKGIVGDALAVYPDINLIFAINDESALGAIDACREAGLGDDSVLVMCVGSDGPITRALLAEHSPLKGCLAMLPELVARVALGAAINAYMGETSLAPVITPSVILSQQNLNEYYTGPDWQANEAAIEALIGNLPDSAHINPAAAGLPRAVGFVVPFNTHEWYQSLTQIMQEQAQRLTLDLVVEDATAQPHAELDTLARTIGFAAAEIVNDGDTIILDHEPASRYMAQRLVSRQNLTVITNSVTVLQTFADYANIHVIMTGGNYHVNSQALAGRIAELALAEFHADKVFVGLAGISSQFGLSSTNHSLAQVQRAMIGAGQHVVALADHTRIGAASRVKIAPLQSIHMLVTDSGISPAERLSLSQLGIQVVVAPG